MNLAAAHAVLTSKTKAPSKVTKEQVANVEAECRHRNFPIIRELRPSNGNQKQPVGGRDRLATKAAPRQTVATEASPTANPFRRKSDRQMQDALHAARKRCNHFSPGMAAGKAANEKFESLYEEFRRRKLSIPGFVARTAKEPAGPKKSRNGFRRLATGHLKELLDRCHYETEKFAVDTVTHQYAKRDIARINAELQRRGVAVPNVKVREVA